MDFSELAGRIVLVTGASSGIGAAVARGFAQHGARVAVHFSSSAAEAAAVARDCGEEAWTEQADLGEPGAATALVQRVVAHAGGLDVLVNNAGALIRRQPIAEPDDDRLFGRLLDLNLVATVEACRAALPAFRAGGRGCVINTTSIAARNGGGPGTAMYAATKGAVSAFTRGLARELAPEGFRVNAVAPGIIQTPLHDRSTPPDVMRSFLPAIPLGRLGVPEDCVGTYLFLACESLSGFITGQVIEINGGQLMP